MTILGAEFIRDVEPGEAVLIDADGIRSIYKRPPDNGRVSAGCVFEYIYFARPDSTIEGRLVHSARAAMGAALSEEHPVDADLVIGVPDSATLPPQSATRRRPAFRMLRGLSRTAMSGARSFSPTSSFGTSVCA